MKKKNKIISLFLIIVMLLQLLSGITVAFAQEGEVLCGEFKSFMSAAPGTERYFKNYQWHVFPQYRKYLKYVSDSYDEYIGKMEIVYEKYAYTCTHEQITSPIKYIDGTQYDMAFTPPKSINSGMYSIYLKFDTSHIGDPAIPNPFVIKFRNVSIGNQYLDCEYNEYNLEDVKATPNDSTVIYNIEKQISYDPVCQSLDYASDKYTNHITKQARYSFSQNGFSTVYWADFIPLTKNANGEYDLKIPYYKDLKNGTYKLTVELPIAEGKATNIIKPIRLNIANYIINNDTTDPIEPEHAWDEGQISSEPTCTKDGIMKYTCTCGCGDTKEEPIPMLGHDFSDEWQTEYDASCTEDGLKYIQCSRCNEQKTEIIPSQGHVYQTTWTIEDATCTKEGQKYHKCNFCDEKTDVSTLPIIPHPFGEWQIITEPTPDKKGEKTRQCTKCSATETEEIDALGHINTTFTVLDTVTLKPIAGANISISDKDGTIDKNATSGADGKAFFDLPKGTYSVQIFAKGYQLRNFIIEKKDEDADFTPYLNKNDILDLKTVVKEMTLEEIVDAGIDVDAAENKHIYKCATVLKFTPVLPGGNINITPVEINLDYIYDEKGSVIKFDPVYHPESGATIYPVSKDIYLIIYSNVTWLKEIFDVQLIAANTSTIETIENCVANLNLPEGLSLAVMTGQQQSTIVTLPDIAPGESADTHWYICGDKEGEYYLDGTVTAVRTGGGISEEFNASFTTKDPISVLAGNAMKLTIEAEKYAITGLPYRVRYTLENVSSKTLNNVALNVLGGKFIKTYSVQDIIHEAEKGESEGLSGSFNNGYALTDTKFKPGEVLSGVFEIKFGTGIDTEHILYMVSDMFTVTGNGSTTTIPTEIKLVDRIGGHNWNNGIITVLATAIRDGIIEYICTDCNAKRVAPIPAYGTGGYFGPDERFSWELKKDGTVEIDGTGVMMDFETADKLPWHAHREEVKNIVVNDGITSIGEGMFDGCTNLDSISIPDSITAIGINAFANCSSLSKISYGSSRDAWDNINISEGNDALADQYIYYKIPSVDVNDEKIAVYAPEEKCTLVVVTMNDTGCKQIEMIPVTSSINKTMEDLGIAKDDASQVKVFLWKNTGSLIPLCAGKSIILP